jgi:hypothetical protein
MARMRHPNLVNFMGLCTIPPCILTGERRCICPTVRAKLNVQRNTVA